MNVPATLADRGMDLPLTDNPLVDPAGKYAVIRSPEVNIGENESDKQKWEAVIAVIDLRTFTVASTVSVTGGLAGGHLFFGKGGTLMLETMAHLGSSFSSAATALDLPTLDRAATCDYKIKPTQDFQQEWPGDLVISAVSESCPAVMDAAHLSSIQELVDHRSVDTKTAHLAGSKCWYPETDRTKHLALYRCGKDHFTDPSGDFGITFWHALKVLSLPDGKTVLSLPLRFYDDKTSGLFSVTNGHDYLIVRHDLKLLTYRLPDTVVAKPAER